MNKSRTIALTIIVVAASSSSIIAQPGRGGFFGGGSSSFGGDFRQRMMERMDRNGDGKLDESEVPERAREFVLRAAKDSGGGSKFPIKISSVSSGDSRRGRGDRGGDDRGRGDRSRGRAEGKKEFEYPLVPGFGDENARGFGIDPRQLNGRIVEFEKQYDERVLRQLEQTMGTYDKDKNGVLDYDEWQAVRWQSDPRDSDLNHDGYLTSAEMAERYRIRFGGGSSRSRDRERSSESDRDRGGDRGRDRGGDRDRERGGDRGRGASSPFGGRGSSMMFGGGSFGGRGGSDRGGDRGKSGFDPSGMLSRFDRDGDGYLNFDKMDDRMRGFAGRILSRYGMEAKGKVSLEKIKSKISGTKSRSKDEDKQSPSNPEMVASQIVRGADQYDGKVSFRRKRSVPEDVPSWWKDRDKNGDGQVSMFEYLRSRSNEEVRQFEKLDANGDGLVVPDEVGKEE